MLRVLSILRSQGRPSPTPNGGRHPAAFSLRRDGCSSRVLAPGASCEMDVSYVGGVDTDLYHHALLKIPNDDGLAPQFSVSLLGKAVGLGARVDTGPEDQGSHAR